MLERAALLFRAARVDHYSNRAALKEIPCSQIWMLADMDYNTFRAMLYGPSKRVPAVEQQETK